MKSKSAALSKVYYANVFLKYLKTKLKELSKFERGKMVARSIHRSELKGKRFDPQEIVKQLAHQILENEYFKGKIAALEHTLRIVF